MRCECGDERPGACGFGVCVVMHPMLVRAGAPAQAPIVAAPPRASSHRRYTVGAGETPRRRGNAGRGAPPGTPRLSDGDIRYANQLSTVARLLSSSSHVRAPSTGVSAWLTACMSVEYSSWVTWEFANHSTISGCDSSNSFETTK